MNRLKISVSVLALASILGSLDARAIDQASKANTDVAHRLAAWIPDIIIHNGTLLDGLAQLSAESGELSFAFEEMLKPRVIDPPVAQVHFDLALQNRTIHEVLDALCDHDGSYAWKLDGLTVNVYPRSVVADGSYLMNRRIPRLELKNLGNAGDAVFAVVEQLPPPFEQIAYAQAGGDISYSTPLNASVQDITVRQAFNLIASQLGPRGGWVLTGSNEFRTIGFHNRQIHYRSEKRK